MNRAFSTLELKAAQDTRDHYVIEGIASTPTSDRGNDIMEPLGAKYTLPFPFLWQHKHDQPIGLVTAVKLTPQGVTFRAELPKSAEGVLGTRIQEAVQSIKHGLVRGASIGFKGIQDQMKRLSDGGLHFLQWDWYELSAVTIPMNAEANIHTIKSLYGAASGHTVVRLKTTPGDSGNSSEPKGNDMKTIQEQIAGWETKRAALVSAKGAIMQKAYDDGERTLTDEEKSEHGNLGGQLAEVDGHLVMLRDEEKSLKATARPVTPEAGTDQERAAVTRGGVPHILSIKSQDDEPGMAFARYVKCHIQSKGIPMLAENIARNMYPNDARLHGIIGAETKRGTMFQKADVLGGSSTGTTWAAPLWQYVTIADEFLEWLRPQTIIGKFGQGGVPALTRVPFNARVGQQTSGGTGYWVGEGMPKPLTSFNFAAITMAITKVAAISVLTQEIMRLSGGDADRLVRNALRGALIERLDRDFVDPDFAGSANVSPASITYGATSAGASGVTNTHFLADTGAAVDSLLATVPEATLSGLVWLMSGRQGYRIGRATNSLGQRQFEGVGINGGGLDGIPVITSEYLAYAGGLSPGTGNLMVLVHAPSIFLADDGEVSVVQSTEASLQMLDNPTNNSVTPTPTTSVSMFQTNSIALLAERAINWKRAREGAVYAITGAAYTGAAS